MPTINPTPVPLFAPISNRDASILKDSRLYNGFAEKEGDVIWVYKRPGLSLLTAGAGPSAGLGVHNWLGDIYTVFGPALFKNGVSLGTVDATNGVYRFTSTLGATPQLFLTNPAHAYSYSVSLGLVEQTADTNYPVATVPGTVYLDGTTYVFDTTNHIIGSNFNDLTTWDALNTLLAQIEPDQAVALAKQLVYVIALKNTSTEVFYDAGNPVGSPLGPVQGSKLNVGCRAAGSVKDVGGDLCWVGTTRLGSARVMTMSSVKGESIATPAVNRLMSSLNYTTTWSWSLEVCGHVFYIVTMVSSNLTMAFDLTAKQWYIWTDPNGNYLPIVSSTYDSSARPVLQHATDGNLYTMSISQFTDNGTQFPFDLYTPNFDGGLRLNKSVSTVEIIADEITTNVNISWSDDDYQTFTTPVPLALNQENPFIDDGSTFRKRAYHINHLDSTFLRIQALHLTVSPGTT